MRLRRVHNMLIASALVCSMVVTPVFAEPSSAREEEAQLKEQKEAAQDELNDLQTELNDLISKANQLEMDLIAKGEEIIQAENTKEKSSSMLYPTSDRTTPATQPSHPSHVRLNTIGRTIRMS